MKRFKYISLILTIVLGLVSCQQKELFLCSPAGNIPVNVVIHWDSVPNNQLVLPRDMTVHWYPTKGRLLASDMGVRGGIEYLSPDVFDVMCMDFNGNTNIAFQSNGTRPNFEAYNIQTSGTYNTLVPQLPGGEVTVAEAVPYRFYIDSRSQNIDTEKLPHGDTLTVHFHPKDVLREFTFMIFDVTGAKYTVQNSGAISGMSGSYYPATGKLATSPSTILFKRVEAISNAQTDSRWTDAEKALFAAKNPDWADSDTLKGWTRDWMVGKFVTFGPLDRAENRFRLTVEAFNRSNNQYHGSWGYWHGQWENTVSSQIDSVMGKNGTIEEQLAWRQRNGGYDIVLYNDNRLTIPDAGGGGDSGEGGFTVNVDDWGEIINIPTIGGTGRAKPISASMRASINTLATIPDFVVNGIWQDGVNPLECVFNAQQVYKPESGLFWDYSPKKYWNQNPGSSMDFYAYAPAGIDSLKPGLHNNGTDTGTPPTIGYTMRYIDNSEAPPPGTGEPNPIPVVDYRQEDLLVAVQSLTAPQVVQMNFQHAFSRVTVKAKIDTDDYHNGSQIDGHRIRITRVDLRNLYSKGELQLNKDTGGSVSNGIPTNGSFQYDMSGANKVTLWDNTENLANYRFRLLSTTVTADDDYTSLLNSNDGMFVIPQVTTGNTAVYVEYNIYEYSLVHGEQYLRSATKSFPIATDFAFEIGRQYVLLLDLPVD